MGLLGFVGKVSSKQRELEALYDLGMIESGRSPGGYWQDSTLNRMNYVAIGRRVVERQERERRELGRQALRQVAERAARRASAESGREEVIEENGITLKIKNGFDHRSGELTTDILVFDKDDNSGHWHLVVDERGKLIINEWRDKR